MKLFLLIVVFVISQFNQRCYGFLLAGNCLAPPPCTCSGMGTTAITINCYSKGLNTTPAFQHLGVHAETLSIRVYGNKIKTVSDYAFKNLSNINATTVSIELDSNGFSSLSDNVFSGLENEIKHLELENNNLSSVPSVLGKLTALEFLDISNNPLQSLGYTIMSNIGHSLQTLKLDLKLFSVWPDELTLLHSLQYLLIQTVPFASLKSNVFHSFETSLTTLVIQKAPLLEKIPFAVCQLSVIQSLTFDNCPKIKQNGSSLFEHCKIRRTSLTYLQLDSNQLDNFPDVLHIFPSLSSINLQSNNLEILEAEKILSHALVTNLNLYQNQFKRIPAAVNKLKSLQTLNMRYNDIPALEDNDFPGLAKLRNLYLSNNPIRYISNHAFKNNVQLSTLDLSYSKLKYIPFAIRTLPKLSSLDVRWGEHIPCTCDMSYLKGWNASAIRSFSGQCAYSTLNIQDFIMTSLNHCP